MNSARARFETYTIDGDQSIVCSDVCLRCRHLNLLNLKTCAAFPDAIPLPIQRGENNHFAPFPGDNGIQFAPLEERAAIGVRQAA